MLLKALYRTHNPSRPRQDLLPAFDVAGLSESEVMAAADYQMGAGLLESKSWQQPGSVLLLHPGVVAAETIFTEEKQAARLAFMRMAYEEVKGNTGKAFHWENVGADLGLDRAGALEVARYLREKGLLKSETLVFDRITQPGVDEVEQTMMKPEQATEHFPPATTMFSISVEGNVNAPFQLQQGSPGASQHQHVKILNADEVQVVETFVQEYRRQLDASNANDEALAQASEHLANIEAELESEQPDRSVIDKAMGVLRPLGVGIGVNLTTQGIVAAFNHFI